VKTVYDVPPTLTIPLNLSITERFEYCYLCGDILSP